jgi:hypothetical protein
MRRSIIWLMRRRTKTHRFDRPDLAAAFAVLSAVLCATAVGGSAAAQSGMPPCLQCIAIRLGHPVIVRGPSDHEPDAPISVIKLPDGNFRGFIGGGTTLAVDGATPVALSGPARAVLKPGPPGSQSDCGRWITTAMPGLGVLYGLVHNETRCHDPRGIYQWMSIAQSQDYGLTWNVLGPVITDEEGGRPESEADCTAVDGHDGYWYAYCMRRRDNRPIVARAPIENPTPGQWMKWSGHGWNATGLGGAGAGLIGNVGTSSAYWVDGNLIFLIAPSASFRLSVSEDKVHFAGITEPLILYDEDNWNRPTASELYAYPSMVGDQGLNNIASHFYLAYMYVPPKADFSQRYLVVQEGWVRASALPQHPQVRTALSRWVDAEGDSWTTTGPTLSAERNYHFDRGLGYVMTAPPQQASGVKLDECFSDRTGRGFLAPAGRCGAEGSERRRPGGYLFQSQRPGTIPLYSCLGSDNARFVSERSDCESKGTRESLLGFALP